MFALASFEACVGSGFEALGSMKATRLLLFGRGFGSSRALHAVQQQFEWRMDDVYRHCCLVWISRFRQTHGSEEDASSSEAESKEKRTPNLVLVSSWASLPLRASNRRLARCG